MAKVSKKPKGSVFVGKKASGAGVFRTLRLPSSTAYVMSEQVYRKSLSEAGKKFRSLKKNKPAAA